MRVSSISMYENNSQRMINTLSEWKKSSDRLSTGKRILTPSDDPIASAQALLIKQADGRNQQLQGARKDANDALTRQEVVLKDVTDVITNIKQKLVAANNGGLSDSDRQALKTDLQNYKEQLLSLANSRGSSGNYLFGGYQNDKAPFEMGKDGQVIYHGGDAPITIKIDESREVIISHTGEDAFLTGGRVKNADGSAAESDIFKSIDIAINALDTELTGASKEISDKYFADISRAACGMDNALENNSRVRSEGGAALAEIEQLTNMGDTIGMNNKISIAALEEVDPYTAISEFLMLKSNLEISQRTFLYMQNMTLFQQK